MKAVTKAKQGRTLVERLAASGFRFTEQRCCIYDVLIKAQDHPIAEEIFTRAKRTIPDISHATVYNCLDALVQCGLVRKVQFERGATRFCPNMEDHCHYYCEVCGAIFDVTMPAASAAIPHPKGFEVGHLDLTVRGVCAKCAER